MAEAVSTYTARAAEKLREQDSLAARITVFLRTNAFREDMPQGIARNWKMRQQRLSGRYTTNWNELVSVS